MNKKDKKAPEKEESILKNAASPILENEQETPTQEASVSDLQEEVQKWKDLALRSQAEMDNLRKRTQIDIE